MRNSAILSPLPIWRVQNGMTCISPSAPTGEIAYLLNPLSTWISPSTSEG
jgi:hypothetical protein